MMIRPAMLCLSLASSLQAQGVSQATPPPSAVQSATAAPSQALASLPRLDEGLLDQNWFGPAALPFKKDRVLDFFWIKPGFSLKGRTLKLAEWGSPLWLGPERDERDRGTAQRLTAAMPDNLMAPLAKELSPGGRFSKTDGELVLIGRFVDCNAKDQGAKIMTPFFANNETATWDFKILDGATGELLFASHHRMVSGSMSTLEGKIQKWARAFAGFAKTSLTK